MNTRTVFINSLDQLRAGWRIALFVLILALLATPALLIAGTVSGLVGQKSMIAIIATTALFALAGIAACYLALRYVDRRSFFSMGLGTHPRAMRELGWGLAMGFVMLSAAAVTMWTVGYASFEPALDDAEWIATGLTANLLLYIIVGFNEEILFRGYFYQALSEGTNYWVAMALISLLFGVAHMGNPNASDHPFGIVNIVLAGILLSYAYVQTRSLWFPIGIHISWNFTQGYIWGMPVSGTPVFQPMVRATVSGPDWVTGGTFGPEGGVLCTLACLAAIFVMWKFIHPTEIMQRAVDEARSTRAFPVKENDPAAATKELS